MTRVVLQTTRWRRKATPKQLAYNDAPNESTQNSDIESHDGQHPAILTYQQTKFLRRFT